MRKEFIMDENNKENTTEQIGNIGPRTDARLNGISEMPEKKNGRLKKALLRAGAAFLGAVILLAVTQFSILTLKKGATEIDAFQNAELGAFVKRDIFAIVGFYPNDGSDGTELSPYALVPMGGKFVTVHFTKRYLESAQAVQTATYDYVNNGTPLDKYFVVQGTTTTLPEALSTQMYDWFALNKDWMVEAGVIADTEDNAEYLSDVMLEVDTVNGMSQTLVFVLTGLAAVLLLYFFVELVLMAAGVYMDRPTVLYGGPADGPARIMEQENRDNNAVAAQTPQEKPEDQEDTE